MGENEEVPFLKHHPSAEFHGYDHRLQKKRTGTVWTAFAHIITAVIGSGVLSLGWSTAQLGWIAGPIAIAVCAGITLVSAFLLSDCYRSPEPETGHHRNQSFLDALGFYLGKGSQWVCGCFQQVGLFGGVIAYTITAATCMRFVKIGLGREEPETRDDYSNFQKVSSESQSF